MNRSSIVARILLGVTAICLLLILFARVRSAEPTPSAPRVDEQLATDTNVNAAIVTTPTPGLTAFAVPTEGSTPTIEVINRRYILAGASPQKIAEYVIREIAPGYVGPQGPMEIMLARPVTRTEVPQLGLGCLPDNVASEEPPYVLVILRGDFTLSGIPGAEPSLGALHHYVSLIMDVWAAKPSLIIASKDGGRFRTALGDPSLPEVGSELPSQCPPRTPGTLPHGAVLRGTAFPTSPPLPTPATTPIVPSPVPTTGP